MIGRGWIAAAAGIGLWWAGASAGLAADGRKSGIEKIHRADSVRPQDDLYRHVNGRWIDESKIPDDRSTDGAFYGLRDRSEADLRSIIEKVASATNPPGSDSAKVGDLYASFLDEATADRLGVEPIRPQLAEIEAVADPAALARLSARLQKIGVGGLLGMSVDTDAKQSDRYILYLSQAGIGLPDESYYREDKFKEIRAAYVDHIRKSFEIVGIADPAASADRVMATETRLAKGHLDRVKNRDDTLTYNKFTRAALAALTPRFDWPAFFAEAGAGAAGDLIVRQPEFFKAMDASLVEVPLADWKRWLQWEVIRAYSPFLGRSLSEENFQFYGKTLTGAPQQRPRWKRGVALVEGSMGEAAGKLYVAERFPPAAKAKMRTLVGNLIEAYRRDIDELDWMGPETKAKAKAKLAKFTPKIGYPDRWRDYSALVVRRDDLVGNVRRASAFEHDRNLAKLGKPVDRDEWMMTPQTVNAYYNPGMNEIVFPAAILQPPFFDMEADDAVNYGGIGGVIGHEIGHGFDDQGSKYDGDGNMNDWWTASDRKEFEARAKRLIEQYDGFTPALLPGQHVNGALTIGENIGDLGGLTIALKAYKIALDGHASPTLDGLTGDQRLLTGWAQVWRAKARDAEAKRRLIIDPHSPPEFRCNGVVSNVPEFYDAFDVKPGDRLYLAPEKRVRIW